MAVMVQTACVHQANPAYSYTMAVMAAAAAAAEWCESPRCRVN